MGPLIRAAGGRGARRPHSWTAGEQGRDAAVQPGLRGPAAGRCTQDRGAPTTRQGDRDVRTTQGRHHPWWTVRPSSAPSRWCSPPLRPPAPPPARPSPEPTTTTAATRRAGSTPPPVPATVPEDAPRRPPPPHPARRRAREREAGPGFTSTPAEGATGTRIQVAGVGLPRPGTDQPGDGVVVTPGAAGCGVRRHDRPRRRRRAVGRRAGRAGRRPPGDHRVKAVCASPATTSRTRVTYARRSFRVTGEGGRTHRGRRGAPFNGGPEAPRVRRPVDVQPGTRSRGWLGVPPARPVPLRRGQPRRRPGVQRGLHQRAQGGPGLGLGHERRQRPGPGHRPAGHGLCSPPTPTASPSPTPPPRRDVHHLEPPHVPALRHRPGLGAVPGPSPTPTTSTSASPGTAAPAG